MADRRILVDLTIAHNSESKLPWLLVTFAKAHGGNSNEHIILLEVNWASFGTFKRIDLVSLSVAVYYFKAAQVLLVLLVDSNLLDGSLLKVDRLELMSCCTHDLWFLTLIVSTPESREILVAVSPSAERNMTDPHVVHVLTTLETLNCRPSLVQSEIITNRFSLLYKVATSTYLWRYWWSNIHRSSIRHLRLIRSRSIALAAHLCETKSSWSFVRLTIAIKSHSNENFILIKVNLSRVYSAIWTNQISLSVAIEDFEASHVALTFFAEDLDILDALLFQSEGLESVSWYSHKLWRLALIICDFHSGKVNISVAPSAPRNLSKSHVL